MFIKKIIIYIYFGTICSIGTGFAIPKRFGGRFIPAVEYPKLQFVTDDNPPF